MKRTALKRKTPLTARQPMRRKATSPRRSESQPKPRKADTRFRSPSYLAFVRTLPCCACDITPCDAHHVVGIYGAGGMGLKAEDSLSMPLCRACHMELHREPWWLHHQPSWIKKTIDAGLDQFPAGPIHEALIEARAFIQSKQEVV